MPNWFNAFDYIEATLWAIAYGFVIAAGFKSKASDKLAIPFTSVLLNFSWEILSVIDLIYNNITNFQGYYIRVLWLIMDIPILYLCYKKMNMYSSKKSLKAWFFCSLIALLIVFGCLFTVKNGMLFSSFYINLRMEILFFTKRKQLDSTYRIPIATFKLLGSIFTGTYYSFISPVIPLLIIPAITFDVLYLVYAIKEKLHPEKNQLKDKPSYSVLIDFISKLFSKKSCQKSNAD